MADEADLEALEPVAQAAFDAAIARFSALAEKFRALSVEADVLRQTPALTEEGAEAGAYSGVAVAAFERHRLSRLRAIEASRAELRGDLDVARAEATRAFGRLQVIREIASRPPDARYRR